MLVPSGNDWYSPLLKPWPSRNSWFTQLEHGDVPSFFVLPEGNIWNIHENPWLYGFFYVGKYSTMAIEIVHLFIKHGDFPYLC